MQRHLEDLAIRKLAMEWNSGWDCGDVEALLALYGDEPILLPQGQPAIVGKDAIRSAYQSVFENYVIKGNGAVVEIEVEDNLGYLWSSYTLTATPRARGDTTTSKGKSIFIVKRQADNSWKIARLMDNSDEEA